MAKRTIQVGSLKGDGAIHGAPTGIFEDLYHFLVTSSWPALIGLIAAAFTLANLLFATGYYFDHGIENARTGSFADMFFFSVQTMATIGYGKMEPVTLFSNILVSIEALTGLLALALMTGLVFSKFSRPTARVRFSRYVVIGPRDGVHSLMIRAANLRANRIVEADMHVVLARQEVTAEGDGIRRLYDLTSHAKPQRDVRVVVDRGPSDCRGQLRSSAIRANRWPIAQPRSSCLSLDSTRRSLRPFTPDTPSNLTRSSGTPALRTCWCSTPTAAEASTTRASTKSRCLRPSSDASWCLFT